MNDKRQVDTSQRKIKITNTNTIKEFQKYVFELSKIIKEIKNKK